MSHVPYHFFDDQVEWPVPPAAVLRADRRTPILAQAIRELKRDVASSDLGDIFVDVVIPVLFAAAFIATILLILYLATGARP